MRNAKPKHLPAGTISIRKQEHLRTIRRDPAVDRGGDAWEDVRLTHRALPEIALAEVDPAIRLFGKTLSFPLIISAMTGGAGRELERINRNLAIAAESAGVGLGVGSQRVMLDDPRAARSFALRPLAPRALLLANLGAVQLNRGFGPAECRAAVRALDADALCLHLNPLQEAVQTDGDTDFRGLARKIGAIVRALDVPVMVKEVGCGISPADAHLLLRQGVKYLDVAGAGGTSWSRIEYLRRARGDDANPGLLFQDWGIPTPTTLRALRPQRGKATLIASGGIRSGLDMARALVLGASVCAAALPFLEPARESAAAVAAVLARWRREFVTAMFLLGARRARDLVGREDLLMTR